MNKLRFVNHPPAERLALFISVMVLASAVTGCRSDRKSQQSVEAVTSDLISAADEPGAPGEDEASGGETAQAPDYSEGTQDLMVDGTVLQTQFYTITVPEEWEELATYRYYQFPQDQVYRLEIFENTSSAATEGIGGRVACLILSERYGEETGLKSAEYLGRLVHEDGSYYYVLMEYPSREQYTDASRVSYDNVLLGARSMGSRIEGRQGYTFEAGSSAQAEEQAETEE